MTAPIWMAAPPEVHSALLSSGPGPGALLAAAGAWTSLGAEYAAVAEELSGVLAAVQAGAWEGPSAESYVAAHVPYLLWLMQASTKSAAAATQHETAAAAYTAALAAMPTLPELAANHLIHEVLVATNFFGINTIPIALNEADYVRMWIQAATTMTTYQAVSSTAVASTPQTDPAPQIQKTADPTSAQGQATQTDPSTGLGNLLSDLVHKLGLSEQVIDAYGVDNIIHFLNNPVSYTMTHAVHELLTDPLALLENPLLLFYDGDEVFFPLGYAILPASAGAIAPIGSSASVASVAGLAAAQPAPTAVEAPLPAAAPAPAMLPAAGTAPTFAPTAGAPAGAPGTSPAPATSTVANPAAPTPLPAAGGAGFVPPYAVGPPGIGFDSASASASSSAKREAPQPDIAAAAAPVAAREQARARRRLRAGLRGYGDEPMDMNVEVNPDWGTPPSTVGSDQRAGPLGLAGTVRKEAAGQAAGLATLAGDEFGGGPTMPMMPGAWQLDGEPEHGDNT
ncbi:PPE family protein [Candidatus Mycobacterium methanotrophicum]|uniref:PPE family protein n=1 Tax=Candidatus Mycobacterium methanotrophicum TaxID=2943498 RepID=A0ABY4QHV7_9MYCO|nr:PPE family protein [Candidatus Mycobacterium methanotrophicum]UQX09295.1 PPE family protein [Candidatus Mycobacterium methanotrophicum]